LNESPSFDSNRQRDVLKHQLITERVVFKLKDGAKKTIAITERRLGKGGQASVYYAFDETNNKEYAVKIYGEKSP
jgi:hypothetical protein